MLSMKNIILFIPILLMLFSCGPSVKEKEEIEDAEILIDMGPSGEISMNGLRIDISAVRENVERIIAENPQQSQSVVISADEKAIANDIVIVMDAARLAGVMSISLR